MLVGLAPHLYREKAMLLRGLAKDLAKVPTGKPVPDQTDYLLYSYEYFPNWAARHFLERALGKTLPLIEAENEELKEVIQILNSKNVQTLPWHEYLELDDRGIFQALAYVKIAVLTRVVESVRPLVTDAKRLSDMDRVLAELKTITALESPKERLERVNSLASDPLWAFYMEEDPLRFFGTLVAAILDRAGA